MNKGQVRRKELGISVKKIAQTLDLTESYICALLAGRYPVKKRYLRELSELLEMPEEDILKPA